MIKRYRYLPNNFLKNFDLFIFDFGKIIRRYQYIKRVKNFPWTCRNATRRIVIVLVIRLNSKLNGQRVSLCTRSYITEQGEPTCLYKCYVRSLHR